MSEGPITFTSAASFIIDDIRITHNGSTEERKNLLGGAGAYALYGSRLFLNPSNATSLAYVVHEGRGCSAIGSLEGLNVTLHKIQHPTIDHPRAWNIFNTGDPLDLNDTRGFYFQTPEIEYANHFRILPEHLPQSWCDSLEYIHVCTSGTRLIKWVKSFRERTTRPVRFIWEPSPNSCKHEHLQEFLDALPYADIISPNHEELAALYGMETNIVDLHALQERSIPLVSKTNNGAFVIRAGARGCIVLRQGETKGVMVPAYWSAEKSDNVIDVTGAGNAFLGGFMVGLKESGGDILESVLYGSVAASFVVQQFGPPIRSYTVIDGRDEETWNGDFVRERLLKLKGRMASHLFH